MKKGIRFFVVGLLLIALCLAASSCDGLGGLSEVAFTKQEITVNVGDTVDLSELVEIKGIKLGKVEFASSNENIVTVSGSVLTAKAEGVTLVSCKLAGQKATCKVNVIGNTLLEHVCGHKCTVCGLCQDILCTDFVCAQKCKWHASKKMTEDEWKEKFQYFFNNKDNYTVDTTYPDSDFPVNRCMFTVDKSFFDVDISDNNVPDIYADIDGVIYKFSGWGHTTWVEKEAIDGPLPRFTEFDTLEEDLNSYDEYESDGIRYFKTVFEKEKRELRFDGNELYVTIYRYQYDEFIEDCQYHYYNFGATEFEIPDMEQEAKPKRMTEEQWKEVFNIIINNEYNYTLNISSTADDMYGKIQYGDDKSHYFIHQDGVDEEWYQGITEGIVYDYKKNEDGKWIKSKPSYQELVTFGDFAILKSLINKYNDYDFVDGIYSTIEQDGNKRTLEIADGLSMKLYRNANGTFVEDKSYYFYGFGATVFNLPATDSESALERVTEDEWKIKFRYIVSCQFNYTAEIESVLDDTTGVIKYSDDKSYYFINQNGIIQEQFWHLLNGITYEYNLSDDGTWSKKPTDLSGLTPLGDFGIFVGEDERYNEYSYSDGVYTKTNEYGVDVSFEFVEDEVLVRYYEEKDGRVLQNISYRFYDFGATHIELPEAEDYVEPAPERMTEDEWRKIFQYYRSNEFNYTLDLSSPDIDYRQKIMYAEDRFITEVHQDGVDWTEIKAIIDGVVYEYKKYGDGDWTGKKTDSSQLPSLADFSMLLSEADKYDLYEFTNGIYSKSEDNGENRSLEFGDNELYWRGHIVFDSDGNFIDALYHFYNFGMTEFDLPTDFVETE